LAVCEFDGDDVALRFMEEFDWDAYCAHGCAVLVDGRSCVKMCEGIRINTRGVPMFQFRLDERTKETSDIDRYLIYRDV